MIGVDTIGGDQEMDTSLCPLSVPIIIGGFRGADSVVNDRDHNYGTMELINHTYTLSKLYIITMML